MGTVTSDFNLFYNAGIVDSMGAHSITGTNPLFMNQAGDNYRLAVGSPAIRKGTAIGGITTDLRGAPRGNPPTIGAYEGTGVDVDLRSLAPTYGTLAPAFAPTTLVYTSGVPNEVTSIAIVATTSDPAATIKVNGRTVVSGTASRPVDLAIGANAITTTVTAPGGAVTQSYILTVTRASVPALNSLALSVNPINPDFARGTFAYTTAIVPNLAASTLVTAVAGSASDVVSVAVARNGGAAATCSGTTPSCPLAVGDNTITVTVTAADASSQVYTVAVPRAAPPTLAELQLSAGTLVPAFITSTVTYSIAAVANTTAGTLVTATATSATDTISITAAANGGSATPCTGTTPSCLLAVGTNVISVTVTGPGDSKQVYKVTVPRAGDGSLSGLALSAAPIQPAFVTTTAAARICGARVASYPSCR